MRRGMFVLSLVVVLLLAFGGSALAHTGEPVGGCPEGFTLHHIEHDGEHGGHHHIGTSADQNGDGYICMRHVGTDEKNHLHLDNAIR